MEHRQADRLIIGWVRADADADRLIIGWVRQRAGAVVSAAGQHWWRGQQPPSSQISADSATTQTYRYELRRPAFSVPRTIPSC
jgi:hypothetical protein